MPYEWDVDIIEIVHVRTQYRVEADNEEEARELAEIGDTVWELGGGDEEIVDRIVQKISSRQKEETEKGLRRRELAEESRQNKERITFFIVIAISAVAAALSFWTLLQVLE